MVKPDTSQSSPVAMTVSIVIPVWKESAALWDACRQWIELPGVKEIILAVAGDAAVDSPADPRIRVISCPEPNRGAQQKAGAERATGDVLLFHHADSE